MKIEIEIYETMTAQRPFEKWFDGIREIYTRAKILTRLDRLKLGNFGDCKTIGPGVSELRIHCGPGIRIYYLGFATFLRGGFRGGDSQVEFNFKGRVKSTLSAKLNSRWESLSRKTTSKKLQSRDYAKIGNKVVLLLCGGDKGSQTRYIKKAKEYLKDYQTREKRYGEK